MGGEFGLRRAFDERFHGWVAYTLLSSRFQPDDGEWRPTTFDQRHGLIALFSASLPHGWRIGARFRLASGLPYTPIVASFGNDSVGYNAIRGERNSERYPTFHQLDLRFDKRWIKKRVSVSTYLDIQNVYNNVYTEIYVYSFDLRQRLGGLGMPIFPSVGIAVEY